MEKWPDELIALVNHVESAIEEINCAVILANELEFVEIAPWLEWIGEELEDILTNVLQTPSLGVTEETQP